MKSNLRHSSSDSFGPRLKTGMGFQVAGRKKKRKLMATEYNYNS